MYLFDFNLTFVSQTTSLTEDKVSTFYLLLVLKMFNNLVVIFFRKREFFQKHSSLTDVDFHPFLEIPIHVLRKS